MKKAAASVILAGILWGCISIFIRRLSAAGFDSLEISFIRLVIAALCFTGYLAIRDRKKLRVRLRDCWMFIGTGIISVALFNTCYFYTMINSQASIAVVLLYTSPVFVMILSAILFHEKITLRKLAVVAITFFGCLCVTGALEGRIVLSPFVLLTGLASGLFYALYTIFGKYALAKYDTMTVTGYTFLFGAVGSIPLGKPSDVVSKIIADPELIVWCVGIAVFSTVLPYLFYTWGLQRMDSCKASILVAVEPLVGAVLGMCFYGESHEIIKIIGIVLILAAIVVLNLPTRNPSRR